MSIKHLASWPEYHQVKYMTEAENTITIIYIPFPAESFFSLLPFFTQFLLVYRNLNVFGIFIFYLVTYFNYLYQFNDFQNCSYLLLISKL